MTYPPDQGGHFPSDVHRRVLGNLTYPDDNYGWSSVALVHRMMPDEGTNIMSDEEMESILEDLESNGHAQRNSIQIGETTIDVWRMTEDGYNLLTGPIANEPPPGATPRGPAQIGAAIPLNGSEPVDSVGEEE